MISEARVAALAALAGLVAGCGQGVHDLSVSSDPLLVIHGHVDPKALARAHPDAPLLGALIWAEPGTLDPLCLEFSDPIIAPACPDPYGVFTGEIEVAAPVDAAGDFDLALFHLPTASVSVGDSVTRIAYGSLIAVEDVNGDGKPTFVARPSGDEFDAPGAELTNPDTIVAATFYNLHADQRRVVFREGGFVEGSYFYPAPGCADPPSGFSLMTAPPYTETLPPAGGCTSLSTDVRLELTPLSQDDGLALMCRTVQVGSGVREPDDMRPPRGGFNLHCISPNILAAVYPGICPFLRSYALVGCGQDPLCATPEWDHTASPPSWWPCH